MTTDLLKEKILDRMLVHEVKLTRKQIVHIIHIMGEYEALVESHIKNNSNLRENQREWLQRAIYRLSPIKDIFKSKYDEIAHNRKSTKESDE